MDNYCCIRFYFLAWSGMQIRQRENCKLIASVRSIVVCMVELNEWMNDVKKPCCSCRCLVPAKYRYMIITRFVNQSNYTYTKFTTQSKQFVELKIRKHWSLHVNLKWWLMTNAYIFTCTLHRSRSTTNQRPLFLLKAIYGD